MGGSLCCIMRGRGQIRRLRPGLHGLSVPALASLLLPFLLLTGGDITFINGFPGWCEARNRKGFISGFTRSLAADHLEVFSPVSGAIRFISGGEDRSSQPAMRDGAFRSRAEDTGLFPKKTGPGRPQGFAGSRPGNQVSPFTPCCP